MSRDRKIDKSCLSLKFRLVMRIGEFGVKIEVKVGAVLDSLFRYCNLYDLQILNVYFDIEEEEISVNERTQPPFMIFLDLSFKF